MIGHRHLPYISWLIVVAILMPVLAAAQSAGPRSLPELKLEAQRRADRHLSPLGSVDPEDMREALSGLTSLEPDAWAGAFIPIGDRYLAQAKARLASSPAEAAALYRRAFEVYTVGRWPTQNSVGKEKAYAKALEAFQAYGRLLDPPIETVRIPFEGTEIVGYLRVPPGVRPAPLVLSIAGLDSRKEDVANSSDAFLRRKIALFALDMPGTGQAPLKADVGAERIFSRALDYLVTRQEIDATRIVVRGQSWGGYWAAVLAFKEIGRLRGAVAHGVAVHGYFQPDWQRNGLKTPEYLFDLFPARAAAYGVKTLDEFLAYAPRMSLLDQGYLDKPCAPMLLVNGEKDTQQPIADLYLLMRHGDPKDVWVNPDGGHMGRSEKWPQGKIIEEVVMPWIERKLAAAPKP